MSDDQSDAIADVINLFAAPIASGIRSIEQLRKGTDEFWRAIENLNTTLENLNAAAMRINTLLEEVEEPVRVMIPQLTRTVKAADEITSRLEGPMRAAAPNIEQALETISSPAFRTLPTQLSDFMNVMGEVSKRLGPLAQFAENAGGLFGGLRLPGMGAGQPVPGGAAPSKAAAPAPPRRSPTPTATKKSAAKKSTAKRLTTKRSTTKKTAKKSTARKKSAGEKTTED